MLRRFLHILLPAVVLASCAASGSPAPTLFAAPQVTIEPTPMATVRTANPASPLPTIVPVSPSPTRSPAPAATPRPWSLAVVGDSIPYNHPKDCPGCTGVAIRYATAIALATSRPVTLTNLSEYTGLRVEGLLAELRSTPAAAGPSPAPTSC